MLKNGEQHSTTTISFIILIQDTKNNYRIFHFYFTIINIHQCTHAILNTSVIYCNGDFLAEHSETGSLYPSLRDTSIFIIWNVIQVFTTQSAFSDHFRGLLVTARKSMLNPKFMLMPKMYQHHFPGICVYLIKQRNTKL